MEKQLLDGRYTLHEKVGEGSYSIVFRAFDIDHCREVAIKELKYSGLTTEEADEAQEIFFNELNVLKRLKHEGIPEVYDFFICKGRHYLVMEWVKGKNLLSLLEERDRINELEALDYMEQVTDILIYLQKNERKMIYKDLKPSNIILQSNGKIKLIDFGTARYYSPKKKKDTRVLGTPGYAAPEAYTGAQTDFSSDIYSLSATFYHLATGEEPFQFRFKFPDVKKFNPILSTELADLLKDGLKNKKERIGDAREFKDRINCIKHRFQDLLPFKHIMSTKTIEILQYAGIYLAIFILSSIIIHCFNPEFDLFFFNALPFILAFLYLCLQIFFRSVKIIVSYTRNRTILKTLNRTGVLWIAVGIFILFLIIINFIEKIHCHFEPDHGCIMLF